jgi:hypothetical protein
MWRDRQALRLSCHKNRNPEVNGGISDDTSSAVAPNIEELELTNVDIVNL